MQHRLFIALITLCAQQVWAQAPNAATAAQPLMVPRFVEQTATSGLQSRFEGPESEFVVGGGVATFDCNGDGKPEVFVTAGVNKAKFYRNASVKGGDLKWVEEHSGLETTYAIGAYPIDIDSDSNIDVVVLRVGQVQVFRGLGKCKFEAANELWNIHSKNDWHTAFSATWEAGSHLPTLAFGTYTDRTRPDFPWGNCSDGLLLRPASAAAKQYGEPLALKPGFCALSMLFSDWGRMGVADLRVSNDREYYKGGHEQLWRIRPGQPPSLYSAADGFKPLQIWGMGIASYDVDGNGFPDVFLTSMSDNKFQQLELPADPKNPKPTYFDSAFKRGLTAHRPYVGGDVKPSTAWHAQFEDVNNDGRVDLWIVKGNVSSMPDFAMQDPNNLLLQQDDGSFVEVGDKAGVNSFWRGRGGALVDFNGDGQLDMLVVNRNERAQVWRNISPNVGATGGPGNWLQIQLQQSGDNRFAIGAWLEVEFDGRVVRRELTLGGGHVSGQLGWQHFGVAKAKQAKLRVLWPHRQDWTSWQTLDSNAFYLVNPEQGAQLWTSQ